MANNDVKKAAVHGWRSDRAVESLDTGSLQEMSADDMRNALYERLHNRGLLDSLKSQLRNYMVSELGGKGYHRGGRIHSDERLSLERKVLDSLIYKYLCDVGCDYTVGVFLPEAGLTKREILSVEEMKRLFSLPQCGEESDDVGDDSLLQHLVSNQMSSSRSGRLTDGVTQTESHHLAGLQLTEKLSNIDTEFLTRSQALSSESAGSMEERLLSYQRKMELAANEKSQRDLDRWKCLEIETVQINEREKQQRELEDRRRQLEEEYRRKVSAITDRERALTDSVKVEYESVQRETFLQRQQLLQQSEQLRRREEEIREEKNHVARLQRVNEEKVEKLEQMLKHRENEIHQKELHMDNTLRNQQERCRLEEKVAYDSKYRELKAWEERLKDKESSLEREKRSMLTNNERKELLELRSSSHELENQVKTYNIQTAGLEMKISGLHDRLAKMFDYEVLKESNISLKKNLEMTKDRLDSLIKENSLLQEKYEHMMIDGREKAGVGEIMLIKTHIQRERDRALDDKVLLEHRLKEMEAKFAEQLRKNEAMRREFELQTDRQKYMNREYGELRKSMAGSTAMTADSSARGRNRGGSPVKDPSFYDTSFHRQALAPELALDADWLADISSGAEVSTATEESIVTETRRRLDHLSTEAENLHSAFKSLSRQSASAPSYVVSSPHKVSPSKSLRDGPTASPSKLIRGNVADSHVTFDLSANPRSSHYNTADLSPRLVDTMDDDIIYRPSPTSPHNAALVDLHTNERKGAEELKGFFQSAGVNQRHGEASNQIDESSSQADQFNRPTPNKDTAGHRTMVRGETAGSGPQLHTVTGRGKVVEVSIVNRVSGQPALGKQPQTAAASLDSQWQTTPSLTTHTSPDSQMRTGPSLDTPTTLDGQWKAAPSTPATLDGQWQGKSAAAAPPTSLDGQWDSKRQTSAVPCLVDVAPTSGGLVSGQDGDTKPSKHTTSPDLVEPQLSDQKAGGAGGDHLTGIDPVMQKYMKMIQQQKQTDQSKPLKDVESVNQPAAAAATAADEEESVSEHVLSLAKSDNGGGATDDDNFW